MGLTVPCSFVRDIGENDTLSVVEANMELEVLPLHDVTSHLKRDALRLGDIDRLDGITVASSCHDILRVKVRVLHLGKRTSNKRNINEDNFLSLSVDNRAEIKGMRVLGVIFVRSIVHEGLLQLLSVPQRSS